MKERGIIMSGGNPSAILEGRKTQTRRIVKRPKRTPLDYILNPSLLVDKWRVWWQNPTYSRVGESHNCPYGQPGDRLWVRETWWHPEPYSYGTLPSGEEMQCPRYVSKYAPIVYASDGNPPNIPNRHYAEGLRGGAFSAPDPYAIWTKRPSIFMPRWASRILLEITDVRIERLQDISGPDAYAEGIAVPTDAEGHFYGLAIKEYRALWTTINGPGSWDANPYVWVISFRRIEP